MNFPKHNNPGKERAAKAPYNFVALPEEFVVAKPLPPRDIYHPDRFTGVLHCTLETKTPLYTRAALEQDELGKQQSKAKADSFYIDPTTKQPVIPGSGLRGMLRTLVEIITFSKPQPVTDRQLFFRSFDDSAIGKAYGKRMIAGDRGQEGSYPNVKAGYMERFGHDYRIRPAQILHGTQFFRVEQELALAVIPGLQRMRHNYQWKRCRVWFQPVPPKYHDDSAQFYGDVTKISVATQSPGASYVQGWFIASGWVPSKQQGKHRHWIIAPPVIAQDKYLNIHERDVDAYTELNAGLSQTIGKQGMSVLPKQPGESIPCFYTEWKDSAGNERIAFGHTAMFRLPYEYSPLDLLPYRPEQWQITDFAEAIFGWVDDKKGRTIAGRVSVGDAHVAKDFTGRLYLLDEQEASLTPLLSGPKPTSFQHYLTQGSDEKKELYHYQDKNNTTLRGYKLYWHKDDQLQPSDYHDANATLDSTQHTVMRPVDKGVRFDFDIHFENLATEELGALLWVLRIASDGKHCLKLGMAKPLGLGSVSVATRLCLSGRKARYKTLFADVNWAETPVTCANREAAESSPTTQLKLLGSMLQQRETVEVSDVTPFTVTFENHILAQIKMQRSADPLPFAQLPRVQTLLTLLQWPGESRTGNGYEQTKYMSLPEFRQRRVLPDPIWIANPNLQQMSPNLRVNVRTNQTDTLVKEANVALAAQFTAFLAGERPMSESTQPPLVSEALPEVLPTPQSLADLKEHDLLRGTVVTVDGDNVIMDVGPGTLRLHKDQVQPPVRDQDMLVQNFPKGRSLPVWVRRNKQGKLLLTMKTPKI